MKKRKKIWKKLIGVALSGVLLSTVLSGCAQKTGNAAGSDADTSMPEGSAGSGESGGAGGGKGRFIESEITLPDGISRIFDMKKLDDGQIALFAEDDLDSYFLYTSADMGETWDTAKIQGELDGYLPAAAIRGDGSAAAILEVEDQDGYANNLMFVSTDGETENVPLNITGLVTGIDFDGSGSLFAQNLEGSIYKVDTETGNAELFCDLEGVYSRYFGIAEDLILAVSDSGIYLFDSVNGGSLEADSVLNDIIKANPALAESSGENAAPLVFTGGMEEGTIVYACHDGVYYHTRGGSVSEQLINGMLSSIGDTSMSFGSIAMMDEEHILIQTYQGEPKLFLYSYDSHASAMPEKELKVYALEDSDFLRQIIAAYQREHDDVYVNLQIGLSGEDGITAEDALRALNTDMLAGNGPDVLILDGMPVDSYLEKGILADIAPLVEEINQTDGLFENIYQAYRQDGAIYEIPARFYLNIADGDAEAVAAGASLEKLAAYGEKMKSEGNGDVFSYSSKKALLERLYDLDSANWREDSGRLNEEKISEWLEQAKRIYDVDAKEDADYMTYGYSTGNELMGTADVFGILVGESRIGLGSLTDMSEVSMMCSVNQEFGGDYDIAGRDTAKVFLPYQLAGIVKGTERMEEAENFIRAMLGTECISMYGGGFPVNRAAYEQMCEDAKQQYGAEGMGGVGVSTDEGVHVQLDLNNVTESDIAKLTSILESLDKPAYADRVIKDIIIDSADRFLSGDQSKEDTVNTILQKCNLYLSE